MRSPGGGFATDLQNTALQWERSIGAQVPRAQCPRGAACLVSSLHLSRLVLTVLLRKISFLRRFQKMFVGTFQLFGNRIESSSNFKRGQQACSKAVHGLRRTVAKLEGAPLERRQLLQGAAAALLAALIGKALPSHAAGEPKMSFFGADAPSSPFTYDEKEGEPIYKGITPELVEEYRAAINGAKKRIEDSGDAIAKKSWEDVRSALRLAVGTLRSVCTKVNAYASAQATKQEKKNIEKAYRDFLKRIEDMDYAARMKDQDRAERFRTASISALDNWMTVVGI